MQGPEIFDKAWLGIAAAISCPIEEKELGHSFGLKKILCSKVMGLPRLTILGEKRISGHANSASSKGQFQLDKLLLTNMESFSDQFTPYCPLGFEKTSESLGLKEGLGALGNAKGGCICVTRVACSIGFISSLKALVAEALWVIPWLGPPEGSISWLSVPRLFEPAFGKFFLFLGQRFGSH